MSRVRSAGFTLIEVLVVLVIVAAMAGLLVFSFEDNPERALRREAQGLAALLNTAADEAVLRSRDLGLVINDAGYRFVIFDGEKKLWETVQQRPLGEHRFESGYTVEFALDGEKLDERTRARIEAFVARGNLEPDNADAGADLESGTDKPLLLMLSSGEITPFALTLRHEQAAVTLRSDGFNPVAIDSAAAESTATNAGAEDGS